MCEGKTRRTGHSEQINEKKIRQQRHIKVGEGEEKNEKINYKEGKRGER